jgi:hypothetical protein
MADVVDGQLKHERAIWFPWSHEATVFLWNVEPRSRLDSKRVFSDIRLATDTGPLKDGGEYLKYGDVDDCPAWSWWPPPFFFGFVFCAGGLLVTLYGAKRFHQLGSDGRIRDSWWVPVVYVVVIIGCRLMALDR